MVDAMLLLQRLAQRVRILEVRNPLENASVDRGGLYIRSNEGLVVEGSEKVSGWLVVTGTLKGTGTFDWSGDLILSGSQHVTGPTVFDGSLRINGPLDVYGLWKLIGNGEIQGNVVITGNMDVDSPGRIRITGGSSPATLEDGRMSFGTGGQVVADTSVGGVKLEAGDAVVNAGSVASMRKGSSSIIVGGSGVTINPAGDGPIDFLGTVYFDRSTIPTVSVAGLPADLLMISGDGSLKRTS